MVNKNVSDIISEIKFLVRSKGYIYALCLIILDDFHVDASNIDKVDIRSRLNKNEILLLFGFLVQNEISTAAPNSPHDLLYLKKRTYELMSDLHHATLLPVIDKMGLISQHQGTEEESIGESFFADEGMFVEPIFYAGDGIYDFQYLDFLKQKYRYDEAWLRTFANFHFDEVKSIVTHIKSLHQEKIKRVKFLRLRERKEEIFKQFIRDKKIPKSERKKLAEEYLTMLEFYQYEKLFEIDKHIDGNQTSVAAMEAGWQFFYKNLLDLFTIRKSDFPENLDIDSFLQKFTIESHFHERNKSFQGIGDFNLIAVKPFIQLDDDNFFIPVSYSLFEAVYESPYYWMVEDRPYRDALAYNRGRAGEEIVYNLLEKVFGARRIYKSVKIVSKKGFADTDIDVLCILGNKALCVQVKSKKLTQLSRRGDLRQLKKDFKGAVQDAYEQGLVSKERILERKASFYDEVGELIEIPEEIDEVFILVVTTENYPSLTHQTRTLLNKAQADPHPLVLTIFDLELISFYLASPYDFVYYIRQRIRLMDYYIAEEEIHFLGHHLVNKLWKDPSSDVAVLDHDFAQLVDQNYYLFKTGIDLPAKYDKIENRWKSDAFEELCGQISELESARKTDIIFDLMDWASESLDSLMDQIQQFKAATMLDGIVRNFTRVTGPNRSSFGLTFYTWDDDNILSLGQRLYDHCRLRKYKSKSDKWIGIGCLSNSGRMVDVAFYSDEKWIEDAMLDAEVKTRLGSTNQNTAVNLGKKTGRNDYCPCGSNLKYKKCCGRA